MSTAIIHKEQFDDLMQLFDRKSLGNTDQFQNYIKDINENLLDTSNGFIVGYYDRGKLISTMGCYVSSFAPVWVQCYVVSDAVGNTFDVKRNGLENCLNYICNIMEYRGVYTFYSHQKLRFHKLWSRNWQNLPIMKRYISTVEEVIDSGKVSDYFFHNYISQFQRYKEPFVIRKSSLKYEYRTFIHDEIGGNYL